MDYFRFEARMKRLAYSASERARFRFAQDTLLLLHRAATKPLARKLTPEQRNVVEQLLANVIVASTDECKAMLDEIGAIRSSPYIADLLSAVRNWLDYRATRNLECIFRMAVDMVNMLDYHIGGDSGKYSTDNMRGAKAMREECHRQAHFLAEW